MAKRAEPLDAAANDPQPHLVTRRCPVCDWQDIVIESDAALDCPQCHAPTAVVAPPSVHGKNPHAAALGRLGGARGGHARAEALSARRRREIARNAARARWRKPR
jgi:hypothetical protein